MVQVASGTRTASHGGIGTTTLPVQYFKFPLPAWVVSLLTEPRTGKGIGVLVLSGAEANGGTTVLEGALAAAAATLTTGAEDDEVKATGRLRTEVR